MQLISVEEEIKNPFLNLIAMEGLHSKLNFNRALDVILELRLKTKMSAETAEVCTLKHISNTIPC